MITAALLLASASAPAMSAVDAERAFAADAARIGQWTAFRKWADKDAVMFTPQAVWARDLLADRKDPAKSIRWRAAISFVSCDGRTAVNSGPWFTPAGVTGGYFSTVWQRSNGQWRWVYDGGLPSPAKPSAASRPVVQRASCAVRAPGAPVMPPPKLTSRQASKTPEDNGRGESADKTLGWDWKVAPGGTRTLRVYLWNGSRYVPVIDAVDPAPKKKK